MPNPSTSGTTLAKVTNARSRFVRDGTVLATAQPIRKCVIGLIRVGEAYVITCNNSIGWIWHFYSGSHGKVNNFGLQFLPFGEKTTVRDEQLASKFRRRDLCAGAGIAL